jgi:metal-responsive CopG/Arc/MetJ family transcriptional regulator
MPDVEKIAVSLPKQYLYEIEAWQRIHDIDSRSAAIRDIIDEYDNLRNEYDQLHTEYEEIERELESVKNEKRTLIEQREENTELVEYVEREKDMQERYREAGIVTKAKWAIFGMDSNDE